MLVRITVHNRGPEAARLRVLPTLWFRNIWSRGNGEGRPSLREAGPGVVQATHQELGEYWLHCDDAPELLFTENESNAQRLWGQPNASAYVKDAFHSYVIAGQADAVNPARVGTKAAAHYTLDVPAGGSKMIRLRLAAARTKDPFRGFEKCFQSRIADADEFYERIAPRSLTEDQRRVHRQTLAGMLWSKQYYYFDLELWLREHKSHPKHPFVFNLGGQEHKVQYLPAESDSGMFGGNSNWRGPVWMPVNMLIVRALVNLYGFYGDEFKVQCPTGSGQYMTLFEVAQELVRRLTRTFLRGADGRRPVYGATARFQDDPHWRDLILFYEYFHGDNGAGPGACHQTGWTGLVAPLLDIFGRADAKTLLETDRRNMLARFIREQVAGEPATKN